MNREFILELATLLQKYDASLSFDGDDCVPSEKSVAVYFGADNGTTIADTSSIEARNLFKLLSMSNGEWLNRFFTGF